MIKFDFTSHFIIVLRLMVILVSTLIIINSSVNSKWGMGLLCIMSKGLQSICYATVENYKKKINCLPITTLSVVDVDLTV